MTNEMSIRVFLNPNCNYGRGSLRWQKIKEKLYNQIGKFETEEILSPDKFITQLSQAREKMFIAGGGDGTVNLLLNAIMKSGIDRENVAIGAIGLGSSNDFHKPFRPDAHIDKIPVRVDFNHTICRDIIRVEYQNDTNNWDTRYCLLNASIGLTAQGNSIFNSRLKFISMLQKLSVDTAIIASAIKSILTFQDILCRLNIDDVVKEDILVTNLGIIKNPHFAGSLCYDTPIKLDDGKFAINLLTNLSVPERLMMIIALSNHRFQGLPKTRYWYGKELSVKGNRTFALEMDGEIVKTNHAKFSIIPKAIKCCQ